MELHERIFDLRKRAGLSQEQLSEQVGVSRQAVGKWESGQALPDIENLIRLSRVLGTTVDALLGMETGETKAEGALTTAEVEALLKEQENRTLAREQEREQKRRVRDKVDEDMARQRRLYRYAAAAAAALAVVILVSVLLVRIGRLNDDIEDLRQKNSMMQADMSDRIGELEREITGLIKDYASLFSAVNVDVTDYDHQTGDVIVSAAVTPKSVNDGITVQFTARSEETGEVYTAQASLGSDGYGAEFSLPGGTYEISASIDNGGVTTTESLGRYAATPIGLEARYQLDWHRGTEYKNEVLPEGTGINYRPCGVLIISGEAGRNPARKLTALTVTLYKNGDPVDEISLDTLDPKAWVDSYTPDIPSVSGQVSEYYAPEDGFLFVSGFDFGDQSVQSGDEFRISVTAVDTLGLEYYKEDLEVQHFTATGSGGHMSAGHFSLRYELYE